MEPSLRISISTVSTRSNKTGTWRFARPIYRNKTSPCSAACPAGEDIPGIEALVSQGRLKEAAETILMENPFPSVCGRVCFHPCEASCNRAKFDESVSIHSIERYVGDAAIADQIDIPVLKRPAAPKRILIAGAGPAGLSAAWFLSLLGHSCHIREARSEPGGIFRWGIPEYRLPKSILKKEISRILDKGIVIQTRAPVLPQTITEAPKKYDAVFIGCGHGDSAPLNIPGEELAKDGLAFLSDIRYGRCHAVEKTSPSNGETVVVIGGGNTAIDVSRCLIRLGKKPLILYRRRKKDMPAFSHEIQSALDEGAALQELSAPVKIEKKGDLFLIHTQKMKLDGRDGDRARVSPDKEKINILRAHGVIIAAGAESKSWRPPCPPDHSNGDDSSNDRFDISLSHCRIVKQFSNRT